MKHCSRILISPKPVARTPRRFGVNIEVQEHADRTNLWDWLADLDCTAVREFHPEVSLRTRKLEPGGWGPLRTRSDYEALRARVRAQPRGPHIHWDSYAFGQAIPWLGIPDRIIANVTHLGMTPLVSLGYGTSEFARPLIVEVGFEGTPSDAQIDWEAAASAYDYYFAVMFHYAADFGCTHFTLINEPENRWGWFHLPPDLQALGARDFWTRTSWDDGDPQRCGRRYFAVLAAQFGVLARVARDALEDVRSLLTDRPQASALCLSGPTTVIWEPFWEQAAPFLDTCDVHHYHTRTSTFRSILQSVATHLAGTGKSAAMSEFNRYSGGIQIEKGLFSLPASLELADLVMTMLGDAPAHPPPVEFLTLYLLHFPSTHRNYKHLLYGDMNTVDWSGRDLPPRKRAEETHPTFEELQVRHTTPAYFMMKMLTRAAGTRARPGPHPVLPVGITNPTSSGPDDVHPDLRVLAVSQSDRLVVTFLNPGHTPARNVELNLGKLRKTYRGAVIRETSRTRRDEATAGMNLGPDAPLRLDVPAQSMVQAILLPKRLPALKNVKIEEVSTTPGGLAGLEPLQTTRLRAVLPRASGTLDVSDLAITWESSHPQWVRVYGTGLVQCLYPMSQPVTLSARSVEGSLLASVTIPAAHA